MSNLPRGNTLNTIADLQNVIVGIILRQHEPFLESDIYAQVEKWCGGSVFDRNSEGYSGADVNKRIDDTLNTLHIIGSVRFDDKEHKYVLNIGFPAVNKR